DLVERVALHALDERGRRPVRDEVEREARERRDRRVLLRAVLPPFVGERRARVGAEPRGIERRALGRDPRPARREPRDAVLTEPPEAPAMRVRRIRKRREPREERTDEREERHRDRRRREREALRTLRRRVPLMEDEHHEREERSDRD